MILLCFREVRQRFYIDCLAIIRSSCDIPSVAPIKIDHKTTETVSGWLFFIANSAIVQLYHGENKIISMK